MHIPVLLQEVMTQLACFPGKTMVDATVGYGGHAEAILQKTAPNGMLIGCDLDPDALAFTRERLALNSDRVKLFQTQSHHMDLAVKEAGLSAVHGVLLDLGISSGELADDHRGFSFQHEGLLDMRYGTRDVFDPDFAPQTAGYLLNHASEAELTTLLQENAQERLAKRIARGIVGRRKERELARTSDLVEVIQQAYRGFPAPKKIHVATKTFLALRVAVNQEIDNLWKSLESAVRVLDRGGRLAVITFHQTEDRTVKKFFRHESKDCVCPPSFPVCRCHHHATLKILTTKPIKPTLEEQKNNPRARSAQLRVAEKIL